MSNVNIAVKHLTNKNQFLKISDSGPYFVGFHAMQIMDLWTMLYHPAKVPAMYFSISLDSTWAHCAQLLFSLLKIQF